MLLWSLDSNYLLLCGGWCSGDPLLLLFLTLLLLLLLLLLASYDLLSWYESLFYNRFWCIIEDELFIIIACYFTLPLLLLLFIRALFINKLEVGVLLATVLKFDLKIPLIDWGVLIFAIDADSYKFLLLLIDFKLLHPMLLLLLAPSWEVVLMFGVLLMCLAFEWRWGGDFNNIAEDDEVEIGLSDYFDCKRRDGEEE